VLSSVLDQLSGLMGNRFKLNAFFPALVATFLGIGLTLVATIGVDAGVTKWNAQSGLVQAGVVVIGVAAVYAVAAFLDSQSLLIVQTFEGYVGPLKWWGGAGRSWHMSRRARLRLGKGRSLETSRSEYAASAPKGPDDLLPTRLGNVLRSGEMYAYERYGIDAMVIWPRLLPKVPDAEATALSDSRSAMEQMLILSSILAVFGTIGGVVFALQPEGATWSALLLLGGWSLAGLCYRGAVDHAIAYSLRLKAIFDAHRLLVFEVLRVPAPRNRAEERRRWTDIANLLAQNDPQSRWSYVEGKTT